MQFKYKRNDEQIFIGYMHIKDMPLIFYDYAVFYLIFTPFICAETLNRTFWKDFDILWPPKFSFFRQKTIHHTCPLAGLCHRWVACYVRERVKISASEKTLTLTAIYFIHCTCSLRPSQMKLIFYARCFKPKRCSDLEQHV